MEYITSIEQLESLFDPVGEAAIRKEVPTLQPVYRSWIEKSSFAVLATHGPNGLDVSPRGDPAPLVIIHDEHTILLPERRGNNRIDSLKNLLYDERVSLIFFIPGVRETVRVNGKAKLCIEPRVLQRFSVNDQWPKCVLEIAVQTVFFQCARALLRSNLWTVEQVSGKPRVPTAGQLLAALTEDAIDGARYDEELDDRQAKTLY
jgi:PPOX class probable FMN-dependent enzyme